MAQLPKYYIVEAQALPEVFLKVAEAKWLLETGEVATVNDAARAFLTAAEQGGQVVDVSGALPKSFVLTEEFGMDRVYLTQFNAAILEKRMEQKENTIHV